VSRPRKHNREEIAAKLHDYVDGTDIPVIAEFCYTNDIRRDYLYEMAQGDAQLSHAIKRCIEKKEAQLEIKTLRGEVNPSMAIFSLKQLGWKDKQEFEHSGETGVRIINDIPRRSKSD
jgi:hypothetical protein